MPIDPLAIVGVANVVGLVFKPILEDFAKDVLKDSAKDYVKGCFGSVFSSLRKEPLQRALGKALRELLQLIQDELLDCGLTEDDLKDWIPQVKEFTRSEGLQQALRQLFTESDSRIDPSLLARRWEPFGGDRPLPEGFSWQRIAGRFTRAVRSLREQDAELRDILNTQAAVETARAVRQQTGLAPDFDLDAYRQALLERYANLHFQTLDTTGAYYSNVKLWSVFVPQSVRESQEYYPQLLEVPKEHLRRMRERGELDEAEDVIEEEIVEERRRAYLDQSPRPVLEVCDDDRIERLVILGDPGSGKSSLLQFLALRWARIEDPNRWVRQAAVQELAHGWKDDPDTLPWLKERAANDVHPAVRHAVVEELARGWKDDPDTLPWLKDRAANGEDNAVRSAAVHELARGWKDDPDTLPSLKERAANDESYDVRGAALKELARGWKDDPDTLPLLKDRAANDDIEWVRQAAVRELERGWNDDPDVQMLLALLPRDE